MAAAIDLQGPLRPFIRFVLLVSTFLATSFGPHPFDSEIERARASSEAGTARPAAEPEADGDKADGKASVSSAPATPLLPGSPAGPTRRSWVKPPEGPRPVSFARTGNRFLPSDSPRELILTFDDGPDLRTTPIVLDELDRRGLKGLFFVTGWRLDGDRPEDEARRDLLRKILAHGHMVGNHTFHHANLCKNPEVTAREIDSNTAIIEAVTGYAPTLFRSPYGAHCRSLDAALVARGLVDIGWNIDPKDWLHHDVATVTSTLAGKLSHFEGRAILLLHDTHVGSVFSLSPVLDELGRQNEKAVQEGRPPVILRDYRVFLPISEEPQLGILALASSLGQDLLAPFVRLP